MPLTKVALVGANGTLGPAILSALLTRQNVITTTVLSRKGSRSTYPSSVTVAQVSPDPAIPELVSALRGQDALIVVFAGSNDELQIRYADAAAEAGVQRFIPADFGSCDSSSPWALELIPLYRAKKRVREHLQGLASRGKLSWTSLVTGHFFDWGLTTGFLQCDLEKRRALIFDGGEVRFSATTLATIAEATVRVLEREEETRDRMLFVQSFCVTQNEVLRALERAQGGKWEVEHVSSKEWIEERQRKLEVNPEDHDEWENMVTVVGIVDANWESREDFAKELLGLESDDLDEVVKNVVSA